ncbi:crossover junction endodeoxyribonuclease RuvC [Candidatus Curtissbacteria bacterium RBG_16_39_7]|uniref:Crossover junction endodeoxyribonuclease RuvC n=1 Tax=Candidatus Curtissbacteria bacterium RBG_16_39_7 TaxID=1797707 RepID=A0A1F5G466_9BACT|nr:MAG: crossover junction endodeoxyribonuclease RuvC [Candidatus Curtissbacteria bacterium RBG_16_39_7]
MLILGIDPGTATTGYGVIKKKGRGKGIVLNLEDYGCIVTTPKTSFPQRLSILRKSLKKLLKEKRPDVIVIEELFFGQNRKTAMTVSHARGVILEACATTRIPIHEYQGLQVKKGLTGRGHADKKEIEEFVKKFLGKRKLAKPKDGFLDDAVDALAIAIYHSLNGS